MSGTFDFEQQMRPAWAKAAALIRRLGGRTTARDFGRHSWMFRQVPGSMLQTMVDRGYGRWEDKPPGPKGGRPTRVLVIANGDALSTPSPGGLVDIAGHSAVGERSE